MPSDAADLYRRAIETWGEAAQLDKATEEACELGAELARFQNGLTDEAHLADEIADVEIMLEQLRMLLGEGYVDAAREEKLERLDERLEEEAHVE